MEEITFQGNCEICPRKDTPCRNHHFIPQRLLKILPQKLAEKWKFMKVRICSSCNGYFHPENHLYQRIDYLLNKVKELEEKIRRLTGEEMPEDNEINLDEEIGKTEKELCSALDEKVYIPVKTELENANITHSLGNRKEDFKGIIHQKLEDLKLKITNHTCQHSETHELAGTQGKDSQGISNSPDESIPADNSNNQGEER